MSGIGAYGGAGVDGHASCRFYSSNPSFLIFWNVMVCLINVIVLIVLVLAAS